MPVPTRNPKAALTRLWKPRPQNLAIPFSFSPTANRARSRTGKPSSKQQEPLASSSRLIAGAREPAASAESLPARKIASGLFPIKSD